MGILLAFVTIPKEVTIFKHSDSVLAKQSGRNAKPWCPVHSCAWAMANSAKTPKLSLYQKTFHIWKTIDDSTGCPVDNTAGQEDLSAAIHCSRFCYNRMSRGGGQKSLNPMSREKKVSWMDQVNSGTQILQNFTSISFFDCTQIKLIALLLVGMLISHIYLTQNITSLYLRSVYAYAQRQETAWPNS